MPQVSGDAVIVGIGETRVGKLPGMNSQEIQAWAVQGAIANSGLELKDIDGLVNLDPYQTPNSMFSTTMSEYLGLTPSFSATVDVGGTVTGMTMLQQAVWAITAGHCRNVVCVFGENPQTSRPPGTHGFMLKNALGGEEWEEPYGVQGMVMQYAMTAQRYMHETGATVEDLGAVAVSARQHALLNDNAMMKKPITLKDHRASRVIASPLRLLDCSIVADGGGALVLTSAENSRRLGRALGSHPVDGDALHAQFRRGPSRSRQARHVGRWKKVLRVGGNRPGKRRPRGAARRLHDLRAGDARCTGHHQVRGSRRIHAQRRRDAWRPLSGQHARRVAVAGPRWRHPPSRRGSTATARRSRARQVEDARIALVSGNGGIFSVCGAMLLERN